MYNHESISMKRKMRTVCRPSSRPRPGPSDVLGPAFIKYDSKIIKIHKYTENNSIFTYELKDGLLYLDEITPEGKKRMKANDYMRGLQ